MNFEIHIRHRFENADNIIKKVRTLADVVDLELEGRGNTNPDATPMTRRRVGSISASLFSRLLEWLSFL